MNKNWNMIAMCGNEQLRMALISAKGEMQEGLAKGFPEYFLAESEVHPQPKREDFLRLVSEMNRRDDIIDACKGAGIPYQKFTFQGSRRGATDSVSYADGGYDTVRGGWGSYFFRCTVNEGGEIEYEGSRWLVVRNAYTPGSPYCFAYHTLVIVPVDIFA